MAKPGGMCVGVPIFIWPAPTVRSAWIGASLALRPQKKWSHIQTFSRGSFLRQLRRHSSLKLVRTHARFPIVSGGLLRPLENHRWWWRLNRWVGASVPWVCIEIQAIFEKPFQSGPGGPLTNRSLAS